MDTLKFTLNFWFSQIIELISVLIIPFVCIVVVYIILNHFYKKTAYYQITKNPYLSVRFNLGRLGEYMTYKRLRQYEQAGCKFLFNVYLPKENDETSEIDVLMISSKGIFVFESKNYSGWIFGNEKQKNWVQTLPQGKGRSQKEHFYNPIMQNRTHIKYLKNYIGEDILTHSVIVFSERCTLKDVSVYSTDIRVINRYDIASTVSDIYNQVGQDILSETQINEIYNKLYPCTQVNDDLKAKHIEDINRKRDFKKTEIEQTKTQSNTESETEAAPDLKQTDNIEHNLKCPKCGGELVLRTAKRGQNAGNQFYGCSNYPKCKYIENK